MIPWSSILEFAFILGVSVGALTIAIVTTVRVGRR